MEFYCLDQAGHKFRRQRAAWKVFSFLSLLFGEMTFSRTETRAREIKS